MALSDWLTIVWAHRSKPGESEFGMRQHSLTLIRKFSAGSPRSIVGDEEIPILEQGSTNPKMRVLNEEERTLSGLPEGTLEWGPITPAFSGGGTDIALLRGDDLQQGDLMIFRVDGPMYPTGAYFSKASLTNDRPFRIMLRIQPREGL